MEHSATPDEPIDPYKWRRFAAFGESKTAVAWGKDPRCLVNRKAFLARVDKKGWSVEDALTTPPKTMGSRVGPNGEKHSAFGESKTIVQWSADPRCKVSRTGLRQRLSKGQSLEDALSGRALRNQDFAPKEAFGESKKLVDWARDPRFTVKYQNLVLRLAQGMTLEEALTTTTQERCRASYVAYEAFGESKSLAEWAEDDRCTVSRGSLYARIHKQGMPVEEALTLTLDPPTYEAFGETKTLDEWTLDERCPFDHRATLHHRIHKAGMTVEQAITQPRFEKTSLSETRLLDFVRSLGVEVDAHNRVVAYPKEVDIYLPAFRLGIEYNGVYWHSDLYTAKSYHHDKWQACRNAGVDLIQVWQDDYQDHPEIVHAMIVHRLGLSPRRVMARATTVGVETKSAAAVFLDAHHIQGRVPATVYVGLRTREGELVALCSFKQGPEMKWELTRYATSVTVAGGFTKCLAYFTRNYEWAEVRTFADSALSNGDLYRLAGFVEDGVIPPDYRYVVKGRRIHKFNYRIDRFRRDPDLLFEEGLTERELAELNDIARIWDAGKVRWVLRPPG